MKEKEAECVIVKGIDREGNEKSYYLLEEGEMIKVNEKTKRKVIDQKEDFRVNTSKAINIVHKKNPERERRLPSKLSEY